MHGMSGNLAGPVSNAKQQGRHGDIFVEFIPVQTGSSPADGKLLPQFGGSS